jgi:hypothetical protein
MFQEGDYMHDNEILQNVINISFEEYYNFEDEEYDVDDDDSSYNKYNDTHDVSTLNKIHKLFNKYSIVEEECNICTDTCKLIRCQQCSGEYCEDCFKKIYKNGICSYCSIKLDLDDVINTNKIAYDNNVLEKNIAKNITENVLIQGENLEFNKNISKLYINPHYNSDSDELFDDTSNYTFNNNDCNKKTIYSCNNKFIAFLENKYIRIQSNKKNRNTLIIPSGYYNQKYLLLLYSILEKFKNNKDWNTFVNLLNNRVKDEKFNKHRNFKKYMLWKQYEQLTY